jgi:aspartyl-tRNA(Asn)/glutamyl-tRNA(Gln) amidotransferase subunit A
LIGPLSELAPSDPRQAAEAALSAAAASGGVFWELAGERALEDASGALGRRSDERGTRPLAGVPVAVKDAFAVAGVPQHLGLTRTVVSDRDAVAVARLRDAGAIVIGTTAMDQLGWTMTGQAPGFPRYENPVAPGHCPGGSSGGAAAAVAAGIVPLALAVDSAGSARLPAAWCGVVGFKPSFGAIDLDGCAPLAPCLDTAGIIARRVEDCRRAFVALSGAQREAPADRAAPRVGVPTPLIAATDCDRQVVAAWKAALELMRGAGWTVREVSAPPPVRGIGAIFAANLAARWGDVLAAEPRELVHPEVRAGIEYGRGVSVRDYLDACDRLAAARREAPSLLAEVDVLALPTAPVVPSPLDDPAPVNVVSAFTRPWSAFGWPAITIPCGAGERAGCGIQLVARPGDDLRLLAWASALQAVMPTAPEFYAIRVA